MSALPLSVTQLQMYQKCGAQYEFRYVQGIRIPPGVAQIRGSAVHRATERNMRQKIKSRADLPVDELKDQAAQYVDRAFAGEMFLSEDEQGVGVKKLRDVTKDVAASLAGLHREKIAPKIQPIAVEARITVTPSAEAFPRPLIGIIDLEDEQGIVHDTKTGSKTPNSDAADKSQQLTMYEILARAKNGKAPTALRLDTLIQTEAGNRSIMVQETHRSAAQVSAFIGTMRRAIQGIEAGVFIPTNPENWWCSAKWCGYYASGICPFVKR